jgi:hypothetical protein
MTGVEVQSVRNTMRLDRRLLWILVGALIIRLVSFPLLHAAGYTSDEGEYIYLAHKISQGQEFIDMNGERSARQPFFPLVLGIVFRIAGSPLFLPHVIGCVLGTIVVLLGYLLSLHLENDLHAALMTAGAMALYPGLVIYSGVLQTETLYMVFFLLVFLFAYRTIQNLTLANATILGVASGLAALTRAAFVGFFPILLLLVGWMRWKDGKRNIGHLVAACVIYGVVLLPWTVRNFNVHGTLVPVSSWGGNFLLIGNNPYATGTWRVEDGFEKWHREMALEHGVADIGTLSEIQRSSLNRDIALEYIFSHPLHVLQLAAKKAFIFWIYPITNSDSNVSLQAVAVASDFALLIPVTIGFVASWGNRRRLLPAYVAILFFFFMQIVLHAEARYRLPIVPLLCVFFGLGFPIVADRKRLRAFLSIRRRRLPSITLVVSIVLVYLSTGLLFLQGLI